MGNPMLGSQATYPRGPLASPEAAVARLGEGVGTEGGYQGAGNQALLFHPPCQQLVLGLVVAVVHPHVVTQADEAVIGEPAQAPHSLHPFASVLDPSRQTG